MGKFDGVYKLDKNYNVAEVTAFMEGLGIPDADMKAYMSESNVHTMTTMENKDGSYTVISEHTALPHMNSNVTAKAGEVVKVTKPFPSTLSWSLKSDHESCWNVEMNGKKLVSNYCFNNAGFTVTTTIEGTSIRNTSTYWKVSPRVDGLYMIDCDDNMLALTQQLMPNMTEAMWEDLKKAGFSMRIKIKGRDIIMDEIFGSNKRTVVYKLDESIDYINKEFGIEDSRIVTQICPGRYKMVTKTKNGKVGDFEMCFTEAGLSETGTVAGVTGKAFYKRMADLDGCWKVCSKVGEACYLDACGVPEPMKSELMAARDCVTMARIGSNKFKTKSSSKFWPSEDMVITDGEPWEVEMPGFGTVTGVNTELGEKFISCMKMGGKTINISGYCSGDFIVEEAEVDGNNASKMKMILVRQ